MNALSRARLTLGMIATISACTLSTEKAKDLTACIKQALAFEPYVVVEGDNLWNIAKKNGVQYLTPITAYKNSILGNPSNQDTVPQRPGIPEHIRVGDDGIIFPGDTIYVPVVDHCPHLRTHE